jgi:UDP-4-amino-4,6-dideoxy-N-acetyl-beta-L-altrosamine N-acetyltransferase
MLLNKDKAYIIDGFVFKNYIHLTDKELKLVLEWRNDDSVRTKMYNPQPISFDNHVRFVKGLINREDCMYWIVSVDGLYIGTTNITHINIEEKSCELGYLLSPDKVGSGYGYDFAIARQKLLHELGIRYAYGNMRSDNIQAILISEYFGSKKEGIQYMNIMGEMVKFYNYKRDIAEAQKELCNRDMDGFVTFYKKRIKELRNEI